MHRPQPQCSQTRGTPGGLQWLPLCRTTRICLLLRIRNRQHGTLWRQGPKTEPQLGPPVLCWSSGPVTVTGPAPVAEPRGITPKPPAVPGAAGTNRPEARPRAVLTEQGHEAGLGLLWPGLGVGRGCLFCTSSGLMDVVRTAQHAWRCPRTLSRELLRRRLQQPRRHRTHTLRGQRRLAGGWRSGSRTVCFHVSGLALSPVGAG